MIRTLTELDEALRELGAVNAAEAQIEAQCQAEIRETQARFQARMVWPADDEQVPMAQRRSALEQEIRTYCEAAREEVLAGGGKSAALTHGTVGWRMGQPKLEQDDSPARDKLIEAVLGAARRVALGFKKLVGADLFRLSVTVNARRVLELAEQRAITVSELRRIGLRVVEPEDVFFCRPAAPQVTTETG